LRKSGAALGLRHRLLHPVRIHRTFTFVISSRTPPLSLGRMDLGFVYFVFAPSVVTTLFAGKAVARFGTRPVIWGRLR